MTRKTASGTAFHRAPSAVHETSRAEDKRRNSLDSLYSRGFGADTARKSTTQTARRNKEKTIMKQEDIRQLIVRFMDGHTTVEEEERLAQYFRTGDVPEEWSKYKEMFAFFDEEMPRGRYDETPPESNVPEASQQEVKLLKKNSRKPFIALWSTVSVTAAVALIILTVWHRPSPDTTPDNNREAVATTSSVGSSLADSTVMKNETVAAPQYKKKHRRTSGKYR